MIGTFALKKCQSIPRNIFGDTIEDRGQNKFDVEFKLAILTS